MHIKPSIVMFMNKLLGRSTLPPPIIDDNTPKEDIPAEILFANVRILTPEESKQLRAAERKDCDLISNEDIYKIKYEVAQRAKRDFEFTYAQAMAGHADAIMFYDEYAMKYKLAMAELNKFRSEHDIQSFK